MAFLGFVLLLAGAALITMRARHHAFLLEDWRFHAALLAAWVPLGACTMNGMCQEYGLFGYIAMFLVGVAWAPYSSGVLSHYLSVVIPGWWLADRKLRVPPSFDLGDAAMKAGDPGRALSFYREELDRAPDDPELFLRMAEAHRALAASGQVVACLQEAARCAVEPHRKGAILLMLSEACRRAEALAVLDGILTDPALAGYHEAARHRLAVLAVPGDGMIPA